MPLPPETCGAPSPERGSDTLRPSPRSSVDRAAVVEIVSLVRGPFAGFVTESRVVFVSTDKPDWGPAVTLF